MPAMKASNGGRTALSLAVEQKNDAMVWTLLEADKNKVKKADINSRTPLSFAAAKGYIFGIEALLDHEANIDASNKNGRTPLSWATAGGHIAAMQLLIKRGANTEQADREGKTPLIYACINARTELVIEIVKSTHISLSRCDFDHKSPLAHAAASGNISVIEILMAQDNVQRDWALQGWKEETIIDANKAIEPGRWTAHDDWSWVINRSRMPQALATKHGHPQCFALLNTEWDKLDLNSKHCSEDSFVHEAESSTRIGTQFESPIGLRRRGDVSVQRAATGENSPLRSAAEEGRPDILGVVEREWEKGSPSRRGFFDKWLYEDEL